MIVKTLRIGHGSKYRIKSLVKYVLQDNDPDKNPMESFLILNHIKTLDFSKIHKEFLTQDTYRKKRNNGISYYHEILSFSAKSKPHLTLDKIEDLTNKYLELRQGNQAVALGALHEEKDHLHIHLILSATKYKSNESLRLSRNDFIQVRQDLEIYQIEKYPELNDSIVYHGKEKKLYNKKEIDKNKRAQNEFQMKTRLDKNEPTKKQILHIRVSEILKTSKTPKEFLMTLKNENDFDLYEYRGKITGIIFEEKKYRFSTFGIDKNELQKLRKQYLRMKELSNSLEQTQSRDRGL